MRNQQFLATDSDILNPDTARLSSISTYNYNTAVPPFHWELLLVSDNAGAHTRFFVMSNVAREGEPNVNELSKVVSTALSKDIDLLADSRENTTIFAKRTVMRCLVTSTSMCLISSFNHRGPLETYTTTRLSLLCK